MKLLQEKNVRFPTPKTYINKLRIRVFVKHSLISRPSNVYSFLVLTNSDYKYLLPNIRDSLIVQLKNRGKQYKSTNKLGIWVFVFKFKKRLKTK